MIGSKGKMWALLVLVALVQSAALFKMVYDRDRLLKNGREVMLSVRPLDPRDIFRGDYVTLGYDISSLKTSNLPEEKRASSDAIERGGTAYVTLTPNPAGGWTVAGVTPAYPAAVASGDIVLKANVLSIWRSTDTTDAVLNLRYGIETYFVPEGTGRALEDKVRSHKIEAIVAVDSSGEAALRGLVVDGERHVDPPLL